MKITIGNDLNFDVTTRDMTVEETESWQLAHNESQAKMQQQQAQLDALNSARAKLTVLGLTEAEIKALVG